DSNQLSSFDIPSTRAGMMCVANRPRDRLVVTKLDRFGHSLEHLIELARSFAADESTELDISPISNEMPHIASDESFPGHAFARPARRSSSSWVSETDSSLAARASLADRI